MDIQFFDTLESTNKYCELLNLDEIEEFVAICALNQTAGRGQSTHIWHSEPYQNLSFSLILHPHHLAIADQFILTKVLSLGVYDFLTSFISNDEIRIKWPNDIYVGNNKICGILVNNKINKNTFQTAICGIGININQTQFPTWIPNPTSLKLHTHINHNIKDLLPLLLQKIQHRYLQSHHNLNILHQDYLTHLLNRNKLAQYTYNGNTIRAAIIDVNSYGYLQLVTEDNEHLSCKHGEISLIL